MNTVHVKASREYDVLIAPGLLATLGDHAKAIKKVKKICIVSETNVWPLYGNAAKQSLLDAGFEVVEFVFPAGEASKNGNTYLEILNFLAQNKVTRSDVIIALGGGVVGDLTGFAAATYLRGISYIQIPTTLLAMVDSSVGGKTAIDLPSGKNLAGAFYQPKLVLCSLNTLSTLPQKIFCDGCAEVIKYGVLYDVNLFQHLLEKGIQFDQEYIISRCVELKRDVVITDEFDTGARQMLNLGHTIGHAIEATSHYTVSHGEAVAIGMAMVSKASAELGICEHSIYHQICNALENFSLPTETSATADQLYNFTLAIKNEAIIM